MPFADPMTWIASESRWVKRLTKPIKKSFYFAPKKHGIEPTERASRDAMRQWWEAQKAILDSSADLAEKDKARHFLTAFLRLRPIGSQMDIADVSIAKVLVIEELENNAHNAHVVAATDTLLGKGSYAELASGMDSVIAKVVQPVEKNRLIGNQIDRWLDQQESRCKNSQLSAGSLRCYRSAMAVLKAATLGKLVDVIGNEWVSDRFNELSALDLAPTTKNNRWEIWQVFFDYLDTLGLIVKPKLLGKLSFPRTAPTKKAIWTSAEYQAELIKNTGVKKLVLLLAANCSFYASDCAAAYANFDEKTGTLTMARVKTNARQVVFYLWPETIEAMKLHGKELAGLYKSGLVDGKVNQRNVTATWQFIKPLKNLRHTSQSFLHNSEYSQYKGYMCGLKEAGISETWYSHECQKRIADGFSHLRKCYGF